MTSGALQLCSEIIYNMLIMPKFFAHVTVECIGVVDPPVDVYLAVYAVNVGEMHWMLLAAHVPTATVSVVDSLSLASSRKYIDKWR